MINIKKTFLLLVVYVFSIHINAQQKIINPNISYNNSPQTYTLAGLSVTGIEGYEDYVLINISGLTIGQKIDIPGAVITDAVKRYWKYGLFSDVSITVDSIQGDNAYLHINLKARPRISAINYIGVKKV